VQEVILCSEAKPNSEGNQKTKEKRREEKHKHATKGKASPFLTHYKEYHKPQFKNSRESIHI